MDRDGILLEILERLTRVEARLNNGLTEQVRGHERRIRALEKFTWAVLGVLGTLQLVAPFLWEFVRRVLWR